MNNLNIGDYVYAEDWCYGEIVDMNEDCVLVEYETAGGGGSFWFNKQDVYLDEHPRQPYASDPDLNRVVTELMTDWDRLVVKAKCYGMDIRYTPNCPDTLKLYFHEDYPNLILVDKSISCESKE